MNIADQGNLETPIRINEIVKPKLNWLFHSVDFSIKLNRLHTFLHANSKLISGFECMMILTAIYLNDWNWCMG